MLKILCQRYKWNTTDIQEANFFSSVSKQSDSPEIDLVNYLTDDNEVTVNIEFEDIERDSGSLRYFHKSSDVELQLSDLVPVSPTETLKDFFMFFRDVRYVKWMVKIYYNNSLRYQGVIYPDDITADYENDINARNIISLTVRGYEKEFYEYFSNKSLRNPSEIWWQNSFGLWDHSFRNKTPFSVFLEDQFSNTKVILNDALSPWEIARDASLQARDSNYLFVPVGYSQIYQDDPSLSRFELFKRVCNAMGWIFYFTSQHNGTTYSPPRLVINDRSDISGEILTFDWSSVIDYHYSRETFDTRNLWISLAPHLDLHGGDHCFFGAFPDLQKNKAHKGAHDILIRAGGVYKQLNGYHFSGITFSNDEPKYTPQRINQWKTLRFKSDDDNSKYYEVYTWDTTPVDDEYKVEKFSIQKKDVLYLDVGHNSRVRRRTDFFNQNEVDFTESLESVTNSMFVYSGLFANMLCQFDWFSIHQTKAFSHIHSQKSYIDTGNWKNNMQALFYNYNRDYLEVTFKGIYNDPFLRLKFTGSKPPFPPFFYNYWVVKSLSINYTNETTTFKVFPGGMMPMP
jgi:hypothetical protein